jgi:hypothetical protein
VAVFGGEGCCLAARMNEFFLGGGVGHVSVM